MSSTVNDTVSAPALKAGRADEFDTLAPSPKALMRRRARSHMGLIIGASLLAFVVIVAIFAPLLAPYDPYAQDLTRRLVDPVWGPKGTWENIFGTDALGRDVLSRLMYGARISLLIGFTAAVIAGIIGATLGILGGYFGGRVDSFIV
jgi:peptide/nickel transport system permease protein